MNEKNLKRIAVAGLTGVLLLGFLMTYMVSSYIRDQVIQITGRITADLIDSTMLSHVSPEELVMKKDTTRNEVQRFLTELSEMEKIKLIKVWNPQGETVNSSIPDLIGEAAVVEGMLQKALTGTYQYTLSRHAAESGDAKKRKHLYEVFIPIKNSAGTKIIGVFELHWRADDLYESFSGVFYSILAVLSVGFVITFLGMYVILNKLSNIIKKKDKALNKFSKRLKEVRLDKERAYTGAIQSLLAALDAKDNYTAGHSIRVADVSMHIARRMKLPESSVKLIEEAALFHDIGKIAVPEQILNKSAKLDDDEFEMIKQHPSVGEQIIRSSGILDESAAIIRHHHERIDGRGYPEGLQGQEIPLESQILAVADTFDALTSDRPYRKGMPLEKTLSILREIKGTQLNGQLVDLLIDILAEERMDLKLKVV